MSNLNTRIDKAAVMARAQERARHDRELSRLPDLMTPIQSHADYLAWIENALAGRVDYLPVSVCNAITHLRAELPEALRIGAEVGRREGMTLENVSDVELQAISAAILCRADYETGNLAALCYAVDPQAGEDSAVLSLRAALTETEREALTVILSPDIAATWEQETSLYMAAHRLLPLVEVAREAMRARGLAYDGNPLRLVSLSQIQAAQSAPVGE